MRLARFVSLCSLPVVAGLVGCGAGFNGSSTVSTNVAAPVVAGQAYGGQQPVKGMAIAVYAVGTGGYGSAANLLAQTTTDSSGNFQFPAGAIVCPQSNTPVYILGVGGNVGTVSSPIMNPNAVLGASLGPCGTGTHQNINMNEVTTAALAYAMGHFFSTGGTSSTGSAGTSPTSDSFGGPSYTAGDGTITYSTGLSNGAANTTATLVSLQNGQPLQSGTTSASGVTYTVTRNPNKLYAMANTLAACINSNGDTSTGTACGNLFAYTTSPSGTVPTDTLQAAVNMVLYPSQNVANLQSLGAMNPPFAVSPTFTVNDWTMAVSFTRSDLGLGLDAGTITTLDVDKTGRVWLPSNVAGNPGAVYFDPSTLTFSGPYRDDQTNASNMVHPQQVAIDASGYVWVSDNHSDLLSAYSTTAPASSAIRQTISNYYTRGLAVMKDGTIAVGVTNPTTGANAVALATAESYDLISNSALTYPISSIAASNGGGAGFSLLDVYDQTMTTETMSAADQVGNRTFSGALQVQNSYPGQIIPIGTDYIALSPSTGVNGSVDKMCVFSKQACYPFTSGSSNQPFGLAVDGDGYIWTTESANGGVQVISPSVDNGLYNYITTQDRVNSTEFLHGTSVDGTMPKPYGITVDQAGNVWVSNASCIGPVPAQNAQPTSCSASGLTLSVVLGAAAPTVAPLSAQTANSQPARPTL